MLKVSLSLQVFISTTTEQNRGTIQAHTAIWFTESSVSAPTEAIMMTAPQAQAIATQRMPAFGRTVIMTSSMLTTSHLPAITDPAVL